MISVIVPVYNAEAWLNRCLNALRAQTIWTELELILVDDGSQDESPRLLDEFAAGQDNVHVLHTENRGVSSARNAGLDRAGGEFIAFLDADDFVEPDFYETLRDCMTPECDLLCSGFVAEYGEKSVRRCSDRRYTLSNAEAVSAFLEAGDVDPNVWNKLFRRSAVGQIRFDEAFAIAEDKYFVFQCITAARQVAVCPIAKYHYAILPGSAVNRGFSRKQLDSAIVTERICQEVGKRYPACQAQAESMAIDVTCRLYGELYRFHAQQDFPAEYRAFRRAIRRFPLAKKLRCSNRKHTLALLAAKLSPRLYVFLKHGLKLQYE